MGSERWQTILRVGLLGWAFALWSGATPAGRAETEPPLTQYQVEGAFLYHFTKYVTWPPGAFASRDDAIVIGVLGEDPFGAELAQTVAREKPVQGRPVRVIHSRNVTELARCHVVFISASEEGRLGQDFAALQRANSPALTVGESENFLREGGAIRFVVERNKVRFDINPANAERAGLSISSRLLSLARNARERT
jgi:hypothetical protein